MPLWAIGLIGVVTGVALSMLTTWMHTRNDQDIDILESVVITTVEYKALLEAQAELRQRKES